MATEYFSDLSDNLIATFLATKGDMILSHTPIL